MIINKLRRLSSIVSVPLTSRWRADRQFTFDSSLPVEKSESAVIPAGGSGRRLGNDYG